MPQITINFNYDASTFTFNPNTLQVPYNANETITWKVLAPGKPSGASVTFPDTGGIVFAAGWPGSTPVIDPNDSTKYSADDNNDSSTTAGDWKYTTTLVVADGNGGSRRVTFDPDVQNEGPPPQVSRS